MSLPALARIISTTFTPMDQYTRMPILTPHLPFVANNVIPTVATVASIPTVPSSASDYVVPPNSTATTIAGSVPRSIVQDSLPFSTASQSISVANNNSANSSLPIRSDQTNQVNIHSGRNDERVLFHLSPEPISNILFQCSIITTLLNGFTINYVLPACLAAESNSKVHILISLSNLCSFSIPTDYERFYAVLVYDRLTEIILNTFVKYLDNPKPAVLTLYTKCVSKVQGSLHITLADLNNQFDSVVI